MDAVDVVPLDHVPVHGGDVLLEPGDRRVHVGVGAVVASLQPGVVRPEPVLAVDVVRSEVLVDHRRVHGRGDRVPDVHVQPTFVRCRDQGAEHVQSLGHLVVGGAWQHVGVVEGVVAPRCLDDDGVEVRRSGRVQEREDVLLRLQGPVEQADPDPAHLWLGSRRRRAIGRVQGRLGTGVGRRRAHGFGGRRRRGRRGRRAVGRAGLVAAGQGQDGRGEADDQGDGDADEDGAVAVHLVQPSSSTTSPDCSR